MHSKPAPKKAAPKPFGYGYPDWCRAGRICAGAGSGGWLSYCFEAFRARPQGTGRPRV